MQTKYLIIEADWCKGCALCVKFCKQGVLRLASLVNAKGVYGVEIANQAKCTLCGDCRTICPDGAITVVAGKPPAGKPGRRNGSEGIRRRETRQP